MDENTVAEYAGFVLNIIRNLMLLELKHTQMFE